MVKRYTGVGTRYPPLRSYRAALSLGRTLAELGYMPRSGGAVGMDTGFELGALAAAGGGATDDLEIFLPRDGFNGRNVMPGYYLPKHWNNHKDARAIAADIHPAWERCGEFARILHTRNVYEVLGTGLDDPSEFLICHALPRKNGQVKGGTNTAVLLAHRYDIPVFNLAVPDDWGRLKAKIAEIRKAA